MISMGELEGGDRGCCLLRASWLFELPLKRTAVVVVGTTGGDVDGTSSLSTTVMSTTGARCFS